MSPRDVRLALVGLDRQIHVVSAAGQMRQLTWPRASEAVSQWGGAAAAAREGRTWPTFSPDGRWLACFQLDGASDEAVTAARVCVTELDGIEEQILAELDGQLPLYLQWHPDGRHLAALVQQEDTLQLWLCARDRLGFHRVVQEGVPLFFSWDPTALRILLHTSDAGSRTGRLMMRDLRPTGEDTVFSAPGSFCAPLFLGSRRLYVTFQGGLSQVCLDADDGQPPQVLASLRGLLAVLPDPTGHHIVVAVAPRGARYPYQSLWLLDATPGGRPPVLLAEVEHQAFLWLPDGSGLLLAHADRDAGAFRWLRLSLAGGAPEPLALFWPSRDQLFYLRFFEQYALSHPIVSPEGDTLLYAGFPDPARAGVPSERLWTLDLRAEQPRPALFTEGSFAVFAPSPSPPPQR